MKKYISIEKYLKMQTIGKENNKKNKIFRYVLTISCLIIFIFSIYTLVKWHLNNENIKHINKEIEENTKIYNNNEDGEFVNPPKNENSNYYYYANFPFYQVSFSSLSSINKNTVAFIYIKNTNIKYPVVQAGDNNYYLNHSFYQDKNEAGWIFMDYRNNLNNLNDNTIIYGHSRIDGTMFGTLKNTLTPSWQNDLNNYVIYLSTPKENMIFQIFSIYTTKPEDYYITTNFNSSYEKQQWINTMKTRNTAPTNTEVNINDKFLTLSTCYHNSNKRIVVHAKLIKKQKNLS